MMVIVFVGVSFAQLNKDSVDCEALASALEVDVEKAFLPHEG